MPMVCRDSSAARSPLTRTGVAHRIRCMGGEDHRHDLRVLGERVRGLAVEVERAQRLRVCVQADRHRRAQAELDARRGPAGPALLVAEVVDDEVGALERRVDTRTFLQRVLELVGPDGRLVRRGHGLGAPATPTQGDRRVVATGHRLDGALDDLLEGQGLAGVAVQFLTQLPRRTPPGPDSRSSAASRSCSLRSSLRVPRIRESSRETCIWVTPRSSPISACVRSSKNRRCRIRRSPLAQTAYDGRQGHPRVGAAPCGSDTSGIRSPMELVASARTGWSSEVGWKQPNASSASR